MKGMPYHGRQTFMNEIELIILKSIANVRSTCKVFYFGKYVLYCKRFNNMHRD